MKIVAEQLREILKFYVPLLQGVPLIEMSAKPSAFKWSKQEIIGHLVDSAQNNLRRFIVAQYEEIPEITYRQDDWVRINNYQSWIPADLIQLWQLINMQIISVLENMPAEMANRKCRTSNEYSIEWLAQDYIKHLRHHLHQVLDLEPIAYP